jgi:hypothetical protein
MTILYALVLLTVALAAFLAGRAATSAALDLRDAARTRAEATRMREEARRLLDEAKALGRRREAMVADLDAKMAAWRADTVACVRGFLAMLPAPLRAQAATDWIRAARARDDAELGARLEAIVREAMGADGAGQPAGREAN